MITNVVDCTAGVKVYVQAPRRPTVVFVGHGRAGKDTACEYFAKITGLRNAGTTSKYLTQYMAKKLNLPEDVAYERRHESDAMREEWYKGGCELREKGPATLLKMALEHGEVTGGLRALDEIIAAKAEVDLIVWVENNRVPVDPSVKFTEAECDLVIQNNGDLATFHARLDRLAHFAGLDSLSRRAYNTTSPGSQHEPPDKVSQGQPANTS